MNYELLGISNVLAGGIPILFPSVSKCPEDSAVFDGRAYTMPMHGFAKDVPFEVKGVGKKWCELTLSASPVWMDNFYPYDFRLILRYELENDSLKTTMCVENKSDKRMPMVLGYHPFFLTPDRNQTAFDFDLWENWDYTHCDENGPAHGFRDKPVRLEEAYDTVFLGDNARATLVNRQLGYRVEMDADETFKVVTICTALENASCVEPWQACSNALNTNDMLQYVERGASKSFWYRLSLSNV
ncbi:MAG: hypothetical protein RR053_07780 [Evtepia sp.]